MWIFNSIAAWIDKVVYNYTTDLSKHRQAKIILRGGLITALFMANYMALCYVIDFEIGKYTMPVLTILFALLPVLFYLRLPLVLIGNVFPLLGFFNGLTLVYYTGGLSSPVLPWVALVPIIALLFVNRRWAWIWCGITVIYDLWLSLASKQGHIFTIGYNRAYENFFYTNCAIGLVFIFLILNLVFEYSLRKANQELEVKNSEIEQRNIRLSEQAMEIEQQHNQLLAEKEKSENLLLNILPAEVAEEMKQTGVSKARQYEEVSIIFIDFVGFTFVSEKLSPQELVAEIDHCFKNYDTIMSELGVEKIRTVGDAYIAACGLPKPDKNHAEKVLRAAFRILEFMKAYRIEREKKGLSHFDLRIGINTGPVVAGVVGRNKFVYDIWGDAVNVAARMEQHSEPGKINISRSTYELVKNQFNCEYRGKVEAKNKGMVDMFFVTP